MQSNSTHVKIDSNKLLKRFFTENFGTYRSSGKILNTDVSPYFGEFGSTQCEDIPYELQLDTKRLAIHTIFKQYLAKSLLENLIVVASPKQYEYRFRMDYVCSYDPIKAPHNRFGQRKLKQFNIVVDMHEGVLLSKKWFKKTREIYDELHDSGIQNYDLVKHTGDLRYLVVRQHEDIAMLTIVTQYSEAQESIARISQSALKLGFSSVIWVINDSPRDDSSGSIQKCFGIDHIQVPVVTKDTTYSFQVGPHTFFQNNIHAFEQILEYIEIFLRSQDFSNHTLIDMFCGVGLLGIVFAKYFNKVAGYEINEDSIAFAQRNAEINSINNAKYYVKDLSENLKEATIPLEDNAVIMVDPPRTGLGEHAVETILLLRPEYLLYISCNPITQSADIKSLLLLYDVIAFRGFDLFPHTYHMETVAVLKRK